MPGCRRPGPPSLKRIGADSDWRQASPGNNGFVGVKRDGTLWQAGLHGSQPKQLGTDTNWAIATKVDVAAAALKTDGTLWTWGNSMGIGSLGDPAVASRTDPGQVGTNRWRTITGAGSNYGFVGITQEGELRSWGKPLQPGANHFGEPSPLHAATHWTRANLNHFLDASGILWFAPLDWTLGIAGTNSLMPILTNAVPGRFGTALAKLYEIRSDGTLWSRPLAFVGPWPRKPGAPARIGERTDWAELWSDGSTCVGLTRDGTLWVWGTDWGAESRLDTLSRLRKGLHDGVNFVSDSLGLPVPMTRLTTSGRHRVEETPRALLQMTPAPGGHEAPLHEIAPH